MRSIVAISSLTITIQSSINKTRSCYHSYQTSKSTCPSAPVQHDVTATINSSDKHKLNGSNIRGAEPLTYNKLTIKKKHAIT